ncbi:lysophospholipid acyltransferase family protein [Vallitaleaceae bacterium 9-2]
MRKILFFIVIPTYYLLGLPLLLATYIIGTFNMPMRRTIAYHYNRITGWLIFTVAGAKFITTGLENIPKDSNAVFVSNHKSMLDIPAIMRFSNRPINFIGKKSIMRWPFVGWWMAAMDGLFLDRTSPREGLKTILTAIERIKNGESFAIFPEGTRSKTEDFLPFKQGSLKLASKSDTVVIPIAIRGTVDVFENNGLNLKPATVYFSVGDPIDLSTLSKEDQLKSALYVSKIIEKMYVESLTNMVSSKL